MPELLPRRRLAGATAALMLSALVFAPAAISHGDPHGGGGPPGQSGNPHGGGGPPGQSGNPHGGPPGQSGNPNGGAPGQSNPNGGGGHPGQSGNPHGGPPGQGNNPHGSPGQGNSGQRQGHAHGGSQLPVANRVPSLPPGQAKKLGGTVSNGVGEAGRAIHPNNYSPGQVKKRVAAAVNLVHTSPIPPATAPSAPVTPTRTGAPPKTPTSTPPARRGHRPGARRVSTQRRSGGQRHRTLGNGTAATGRAGRSGTAAGIGRRVGTAGAAGAAAARTGASSTGSSQRPGGAGARPTGHGTGPISNLIGNLIPVPLPVPDWSKPIILALLLISALLGMRAWLTGRRAGRLESQRGRLAADLASLQPALVPEIPARFGPLAVSVAYRPADGPAAGGDFYDVFAVGNGRVAVIVGDVSGHGRAALTRAAHMRYMLRAYVETGLDPRSALKLAGRVLGADEDALFATVGIAVYDASASTMTYATAGHPPPLLFGPSAHEPLSSCASPALGWGEPTGRRQTTVPFADGARACFFSDGVTEVRVKDGLLGRERLAEEVERSGSAPELLERVQQQARGIRDDMAACIIVAQAGTTISEHRIDEFEVQLRHLESGQGDRFLAECGVAAGEAAATLAQARLIAADSGAALIRAELTGHSATASVGGSEPVSLATPANPSPADRGEARPAAARAWGSEATVGRTATVVTEPPLD